MVGRLYDRLGNFEQAIKYYSLGKFVCQSRVVTCLSKKYYAMALQSREEESFVDVSLFLKWAHNLSASVGLQVIYCNVLYLTAVCCSEVQCNATHCCVF